MRITAEFVISVANFNQLPTDGLPEIALTGRSNVGKSSLINTLIGKKGLARTSNTPGRTQTLNYYKITPDEKVGKPFYLVDMPGYGYAAVNKASRDRWKGLVDQYLKTRQTLCGIMQLIDLRHPPQPLDYTMSEWLHSNGHQFLLVGTKADKVGKTKVAGLLKQAAECLEVRIEDTIGFSAETGFGREKLWQWVIEQTNCLESRF